MIPAFGATTAAPSTASQVPAVAGSPAAAAAEAIAVRLQVNGRDIAVAVEPRLSLCDLLRDTLQLTGTHAGCEHGVCGACTVLLDGQPVRACITLAVACGGSAVTTVEGLSGPLVERLRAAFHAEHALQCGFCTPGMLVSAVDLLQRQPAATEDEIRRDMAGNLCRCTGYVGLVRAILACAAPAGDGAPPVGDSARQAGA